MSETNVLPFVIIPPRPTGTALTVVPEPTPLQRLYHRQTALQDHRLGKEMSDGFAYSNGTIDRIDAQLREVRAEIVSLETLGHRV